jgi:hypothetical protein
MVTRWIGAVFMRQKHDRQPGATMFIAIEQFIPTYYRARLDTTHEAHCPIIAFLD